MFHDKSDEETDIVLITNGGLWGSTDEGTHFSATRKSEKYHIYQLGRKINRTI